MHLGIPSPDLAWSGFSLGPLTIHTYALCLLTGIAVFRWLAWAWSPKAASTTSRPPTGRR